jgi:uncharacterized surface protein with fasciclin (FAS1) repeats
MRKLFHLVVLLLVAHLFSCEEATFDNPKYQRPEWLVGKLYSQAKADEELSKFVELIDKTIYADILDRSGYFTLFAPTNTAMDEFFADNDLGIGSLEEMTEEQAEKILRFLVIQDGWTADQLKDMGPDGFGEPTGYKRETLHPPYPYSETGFDKKGRYIVQNSFKYVPLFYKPYLDYYNYSGSDYEFFFPEQTWSDTAIYYAGAKILGTEIPSENGFLFKIDKVVVPMNSLDAISRLKTNYSLFHDLSERFAKFIFDEEATNNQEGSGGGAIVDSLWQKEHNLHISIDKEEIKKGLGAKDALLNNYSLFAPKNDVLQNYLQTEILKHYDGLNDVPEFILKMIVNAHLRDQVTYPSDLNKGVYNGEGDKMELDLKTDVYEKMFATNGSFYGLNTVIKPRALNSVLAPLLLNQDYEWFSEAINIARIVELLKRENREFTIFAPTNEVMELDSMFIWENNKFVEYVSPEKIVRRSNSEISDMVFTQIAYGIPEGFAKEEFMPTISGHYIKILNDKNEVRGLGALDSVITFNTIEGEYDNGISYDVSGRYTNYAKQIYNTIYNSIEFRKFRDLLITAELINTQKSKFTFVGDNDIMTILVPPNEVLEDFSYDSIEELQDFLKYHFVKGIFVFTDGKNYGEYETYRIIQNNEPALIILDGTYDVLEVKNNSGDVVAAVSEATRNVINTNGVVHLLNTYLEYAP